MVLPTGVERGRRWGAAVDVCADELGTHGCVLPDGGALASRRARVAGCQVPKRKMRRRARGPFGVRSGPGTSPEESWGVIWSQLAGSSPPLSLEETLSQLANCAASTGCTHQ